MYLETNQPFMMKLFCENCSINNFSKCSITDVLLGSKYASDTVFKFIVKYSIRVTDDVYMCIYILFVLFCANKHNQNVTRFGNELSNKTS